MTCRPHLLPLPLLLAASCSAEAPETSPSTSSQDSQEVDGPRWAAPELERATCVVDGRTGAALAFADFLDVLAGADVVFLGETHIDETTHRVELGVFEGLAARRAGKVVLAMEMFERDVQPALDAYLAGESSEMEFLAASRSWPNYDTGYRPLIEFAKSQGLPVVASNFPRPLIRRLAMLGEEASLDALEGESRALAPEQLFPNSPGYWRRVDNAIRGHIGMMGVDQSDDERLYSTQSLWDNSMGEACAIAMRSHPGSSVLHVNGGFHSAYWDGTVRQLRLREPDAEILTVSIVATANPDVARLEGVPVADYVVFAESRAQDLNEGTYAVHVQRDVEYRLHLPPQARAGGEVPLLIWFGGDGFTAEDGMALWESRLGSEAAIAVVEAPYRETQEDLAEGGRWFWPDSFSSDLGAMQDATQKIWGYLLRHYPIDPERICIAGEGTGATVVSAVSLWNQRIGAGAVAFAPRRYTKIKDIPLPLPEFRGDEPQPAKSLRLFLTPADEKWWATELAEYQSIGFDGSQAEVSGDPWLRATEREAALRSALGLPVPPAPAPEAARRHILAEGPRARLWARLEGIEQTRAEGVLVAVLEALPAGANSTAIEVAVRPQDYAAGGRLPRCPGPFGGTTLLVLPATTPPAVVEAWRALEADDPLNKVSRFHRLRVAQTGTERDLSAVLAELAAASRNNVLVIPAEFCADGDTMRALQKSTRALEDQMTLRWRPGLGG